MKTIVVLSFIVVLIAGSIYLTKALQLSCDVAVATRDILEEYPNCSSGRPPSCHAGESSLSSHQAWDAPCACDQLCDIYGDCCSGQTRKEIHSVRTPLSKDAFSCQSVPSIDVTGTTLLVVDKCPKLTLNSGSAGEKLARENCEVTVTNDPLLGWPVSDYDGVLYKNLFCGLCNGQIQTDLTFWTSEIQCHGPPEVFNVTTDEEFQTLIGQKLADGSCHMRFTWPRSDLDWAGYRPCKNHIDHCPENWKDTCAKRLCEQGYTDYIYDLYTTYKNKYCAVCNGVEMITCQRQAGILPGIVAHRPPVVFPLSIVLDLNTGSGSVSGVGVGSYETVLRQCQEGEVYDPMFSSCRVITCRTGYTLTNGTCLSDTLLEDCLMKLLLPGEFIFLDENGVYENSTAMLIESDSYEVLGNGSLLVCTNYTRNYTDNDQLVLKFSLGQTIVSAVGQSISIICLGIHFCVYVTFPQLRNLAGKTLLCLVTSLFWAQLLFLAAVGETTYHGACVLIAVLIHFLFLASFSWMHVLAYDVWKTFTSFSKPMSQSDGKIMFRKYSIYGWGVPFIIILISLIINYLLEHDNPFRPAYGEHLCWLGNRKALFIVFALPVALIVANNLIFFIMTVISIHQITKTTRLATQSQSEQRRLGLYIKLSAIMGLTWLFGFVAAGTNSEVMWYLFLIFGSLQGAFICFSFVFTKKVYKLFQERFQQKRLDTSKIDSTRITMLSHHSNAN